MRLAKKICHIRRRLNQCRDRAWGAGTQTPEAHNKLNSLFQTHVQILILLMDHLLPPHHFQNSFAAMMIVCKTHVVSFSKQFEKVSIAAGSDILISLVTIFKSILVEEHNISYRFLQHLTLLPCFCFPFKCVDHVLRIQEFLDTRNLLSIESKSKHIFIVVRLSRDSLAIRDKLESPLIKEVKKRSRWHEARRHLVLELHLSLQTENGIDYLWSKWTVVHSQLTLNSSIDSWTSLTRSKNSWVFLTGIPRPFRDVGKKRCVKSSDKSFANESCL